MNKRMILPVVVLCMGISVVSGVILLHEFSPVETSITEINFDPSAWVNRKIVVEGKLVGPLGFIPETVPPWNYELYGLDETVKTVGKQEAVHIGILWNREDHYAFENVEIVGVVREGRWTYLWGEQRVCYYIEAQDIRRL